MKMIVRVALLGSLFAAAAAFAAPAWVSDQFEITLRSGPSTSNSIQLMLDSGLRLEVLERDADTGYSRVRTPGGTEGWVLSRYLMSEPSAREQLQKLSSQLTSANSRGSSLDAQMKAITSEYDSANRKIKELERAKAAVEKELAEIKRTAANVLAIDKQNKTLMDQLAAAQIRADTLEQENRELSSQTTRYWFMAGALVL
ncbi:MAG: TIGR04211 family SH3 domain-containing protein, partial [Gammaproteobacteria bacterium]|nr:TIGR04211 family SH3 domain-containing protein [Gammaproteobacteria bacterium]